MYVFTSSLASLSSSCRPLAPSPLLHSLVVLLEAGVHVLPTFLLLSETISDSSTTPALLITSLLVMWSRHEILKMTEASLVEDIQHIGDTGRPRPHFAGVGRCWDDH